MSKALSILTILAVCVGMLFAGRQLGAQDTRHDSGIGSPTDELFDARLMDEPDIGRNSSNFLSSDYRSELEPISAFRPINGDYMSAQYKRSRNVGRVNIRFDDTSLGAVVVPCTGVLIDWDTVLTAGHCLRLRDESSFIPPARVNFRLGYEGTSQEGTLLQIDLQNSISPYFASKENLKPIDDYAVLKITGTTKSELQALGFFPATLSREQYTEGRDLIIIHHPLGDPMMLTRYGCRLTMQNRDTPDSNVSHSCATLPGSSGAPIYDAESGNVIAIHVKALTTIGEPSGRGLSFHALPDELFSTGIIPTN